MNKYQEALDILHGFANGNLNRETTMMMKTGVIR